MTHWRVPPSVLGLLDCEVHLWRANLSDIEPDRQQLMSLLAPDEQARTARFRFETDRNHYCVARGLLRLILGAYLGEHPGHLQFTYSDYGKPALSSAHHSPLQFNVSHSHGLALYGIARQVSVGIDVEYRRPDLQWRDIVTHYFAAQECTALMQLPEHQQHPAFFDCWTRKEAYIKAKGQGLSIPLKTFVVSLTPGEPAALLQSPNPQEVTQWTLQGFDPGEDFAGAVAIQARNPTLCYWQLSRTWALKRLSNTKDL